MRRDAGKNEGLRFPIFVRKIVENTPYFRKNRAFLKKFAFFLVFPLDNAQVWGYIWLTLNLEECP